MTADDPAAGLGSGDLPSLSSGSQAARAQRPHPARRLDPRLRGDPGAPRRSRAADPRHATPSRAARRAAQRQLGLDRPLLSQYCHWLGDLLGGSFGTSLTTRESVSERDLRPRLSTRSSLVVCAAAICDPALARARHARACAATARSTTPRVVLLVLTALPEFVIGLGLLLLLATTVFHGCRRSH